MHDSALTHREAFYEIHAVLLKNMLTAGRKKQARIRAVQALRKCPFSPNLALLTIMLGVPWLRDVITAAVFKIMFSGETPALGSEIDVDRAPYFFALPTR